MCCDAGSPKDCGVTVPVGSWTGQWLTATLYFLPQLVRNAKEQSDGSSEPSLRVYSSLGARPGRFQVLSHCSSKQRLGTSAPAPGRCCCPCPFTDEAGELGKTQKGAPSGGSGAGTRRQAAWHQNLCAELREGTSPCARWQNSWDLRTPESMVQRGDRRVLGA